MLTCRYGKSDTRNCAEWTSPVFDNVAAPVSIAGAAAARTCEVDIQCEIFPSLQLIVIDAIISVNHNTRRSSHSSAAQLMQAAAAFTVGRLVVDMRHKTSELSA